MAAEHDFSTWPRRTEAAKQLGISVATLRRYEGKLITPIKDKNGDHRFDPQELGAFAEKLRKRNVRKAGKKSRPDAPPSPAKSPAREPAPESRVSGPVTKRAFEMFERGESRARVAMELAESVENVNWLHEHWLAMSGRKPARPRGADWDYLPSSDPARQRVQDVRSVSSEELRARPPETLTELDRWFLREDDQDRKRRAEKQRERERQEEQAGDKNVDHEADAKRKSGT